jgi:hypothetical protein
LSSFSFCLLLHLPSPIPPPFWAGLEPLSSWSQSPK